METKKFVFILSLIFGSFVSAGFIACSSDSGNEEDTYVPKDGEKIYLSQDYFADFVFINGGKELELVYCYWNIDRIPTTVIYRGKEYPVTRIGDNACERTNIYEIPLGITSIGKESFRFLKMARISLPSTLKTIGSGAFSMCEELLEVMIPYGIATIESQTFYYDKKLASVTIPNSVTEIKESAFSYTGLKTVFRWG